MVPVILQPSSNELCHLQVAATAWKYHPPTRVLHTQPHSLYKLIRPHRLRYTPSTLTFCCLSTTTYQQPSTTSYAFTATLCQHIVFSDSRPFSHLWCFTTFCVCFCLSQLHPSAFTIWSSWFQRFQYTGRLMLGSCWLCPSLLRIPT